MGMMDELLDDVEVGLGRAPGEIDIWYPPAVPDEARIRVTEEILDRHHDEVITGHHMCRYMRTEAQSILRGLVASGELLKVDGKWRYRETNDGR
jgi:hypothetical protein